jgi:hypothetical protein
MSGAAPKPVPRHAARRSSFLPGVELLETRAVPAAVRAGFNANALPPADDGEVLAALPFGIHFYGATYHSVEVNYNGALTFGMFGDYPSGPTSTTPTAGLQGAGTPPVPIIAPFFADVDLTEGPSPPSGTITYGNGTVGGHAAFGVTWSNVGYYSGFDTGNTPTNTFQALLIQRTDLGVGDFQLEFNYNHIGWEAGDADGGVNGIGSPSYAGYSARVGFADGMGGGNVYEFPGSGNANSFLDTSPAATSLVQNSLNSHGVLGRYDFLFINGSPEDEFKPASIKVEYPNHYTYNASTGISSGYVTLVDLGAALSGTVTITLPNLPAGVTLVNATATTPSPSITVNNATFAPGRPLRFLVEFTNPAHRFLSNAQTGFAVDVFTLPFV